MGWTPILLIIGFILGPAALLSREIPVGSFSIGIEIPALMVGWLGAMLVRRGRLFTPVRRRGTVLLAAGALALVSANSVIATINGRSITHLLYLVQFFLLCSSPFLVHALLRSRRDVERCLSASVAVVLVSLLRSPFFTFTKPGGADLVVSLNGHVVARAAALDFNANALGSFSVMASLLAVLWYQSRPGILRAGILGVVESLAVGVLFSTFSRSSLLAAGVAVLVGLASFARTGRKGGLRGWASLLAAGAVVLVVVTGKYDAGVVRAAWQRLTGTFVGHGASFADPRLGVWSDTILAWLEAGPSTIIWGYGFFPFPTDNSYLSILVGLGIVGTMLVGGGALTIGRAYWATLQSSSSRHVGLAAVGALLVFAFFVDVFAYRKLLIIAGVLLGNVTAISRLPERE